MLNCTSDLLLYDREHHDDGSSDTLLSGTIDIKEFTVGIALLTKGTLDDKIRLAAVAVKTVSHL